MKITNKKTARPNYHSRAESFFGVDTLARELGHPLPPMLKRFGLPGDVLADPEASVSFNAMCQFLEGCASEWACPDFGLRLAKIQNLNILGPVGLVARLTDTVGEALKALDDRMAVHSTGYTPRVEEGDPTRSIPAAIFYSPKPDSDAGPQIVELSLGVGRNILAVAAGMPEFKPLRVSFCHEAPADPLPARRFFGCPISYGENDNGLYFDARLLSAPTAIRDTAYAPLIRAYFEKIKPQTERNVVEATRQMIGRLLATGRCSREAVAEALGLHPRTLQRRLAETGDSFADLLDDYRRELALELVKRNTLSLVRIADSLGYADQSAFNQAFRRWTDSTPRSFRTSA